MLPRPKIDKDVLSCRKVAGEAATGAHGVTHRDDVDPRLNRPVGESLQQTVTAFVHRPDAGRAAKSDESDDRDSLIELVKQIYRHQRPEAVADQDDLGTGLSRKRVPHPRQDSRAQLA